MNRWRKALNEILSHSGVLAKIVIVFILLERGMRAIINVVVAENLIDLHIIVIRIIISVVCYSIMFFVGIFGPWESTKELFQSRENKIVWLIVCIILITIGSVTQRSVPYV